MPEIFYAANLNGREQQELARLAKFGRQSGLKYCGADTTSFRDDSVPVPATATPVFKSQRLWHSEFGWEPYRYPGHKPQQPKKININMEFSIPAESTEAHISYSN